MSAKDQPTPNDRYGTALIVAIAVVMLVAIVLWFVDRREGRGLERRRLDQRMDVMEEWAPPGRNRLSARHDKVL